MRIFQRRSKSDATTDGQSSSPAGSTPGVTPENALKIDEHLQEVFVYDEGKLPSPSALAEQNSLVVDQGQPAGTTANTVEIHPQARPQSGYVENLRNSGGERTYSLQSSIQHHQGNSSAMASGNDKFITVPYSLMPTVSSQPNSQQGGSVTQDQGNSAAGNSNVPNRQQIEEAVMTAVQQHVRTDGANYEERIYQGRQRIQSVILEIRNAQDSEAVMKAAVAKTREVLGADRVLLHCCSDSRQGIVNAEALTSGWTPSLGETLPLCMFGGETLEDYNNGQVFAFSCSQGYEFSPYQMQLMEQYQVKASLALPVILNEQPWGFLVAHQCSQDRQWSELEIDGLYQVVTEIRLKLQALEFGKELQKQIAHGAALAKEQTEQLMEAAKREQLANSIIDRIRGSFDADQVFNVTTKEIRRFMNCDRAVIYKFHEDWSGTFIAESVGSRLNSILGKGFSADMGNCHSLTSLRPDGIPMDSRDPKLADASIQNGRDYNRSGFFLDDIQAYDLPGDFLDAMEEIGTRSYLMTSIFLGDKLWGMLAVYHGEPRTWQDADRTLISQIASQCGLALQQADYVGQLKQQSLRLEEAANREKAATGLINRIRETNSTDSVLRNATQEVRKLLNCDRVCAYRFNEDWSGEVVAESVARGWVHLLQLQTQEKEMRNELMSSDSCVVKYYGQKGEDSGLFEQDTHLKETQGGVYVQGARFRRVDDIHSMNFAPCYLQTLEKFQCRAYINVPIFQGDKLWGLLAAYQNDGPRQWQESDINLLLQISPQLGSSLQQAEYLTQLETQSQILQQAAQLEKQAKEDFQRKVVELLRSVGPALRGDLTVRAPVTEDEVGTVADAYNNTIHALRQIVVQVKEAATQVSSTSQESGSAISKLSSKAQEEVTVIQQALMEIQSMQHATDEVLETANQVDCAVQIANEVVQRGDSAMDRTVDGIMAIRSTVSETSKKIKRLSESSQKISRVVSVIGDFTTQTQLLALNAAIEATRAGEYGRGFAVVADEVRSLARQSAEATTEIEKLVQEIQAETSSVTQAMDTGIDQVVAGTNLVNETRDSLTEIVEATAQISSFVEGITDSANSQSKQFSSVAQTMTDVTGLATETSKESLEISDSFKELLATAEDLQATVGKFKV